MKTTITTLLIAISPFLTGCTSTQQSMARHANPDSDSLTKALNDFANKSLIPGFAVSIVNDKEVLYSRGFGLSDIQNNTAFTALTINWVASISKTFIALSVMKLVEEHKLSLDDPINSILPYNINNPYYPNVPITVRHLLTHTSTLVDDAFVPYYIGEADICIVNDSKKYDSLPAYLQPNLEYYRMGKRISLDENIRKYTQPKAKWYTDSSFLQKPPGTFFQYSNLGASIAARIVEIKSKMSFADYTRKYIFEPLQMKNTGWNFEDLNPALITKIYAQNDERNPTGVVEHPQYYMTNYPVSGLKTNAVDLSKYLIEMIKGYEGKGKLLGSSTYQTLFKSQPDCQGLNKRDSGIFNDKFNIATIWSISATGNIFHLGGNTGVYSFLYFNPRTKKGALAYCNLRDNSFGELFAIVKYFEEKL